MEIGDKVRVFLNDQYIKATVKSINPKKGYKNWVYNVIVVEIDKKLFNFNEWDVIEK